MPWEVSFAGFDSVEVEVDVDFAFDAWPLPVVPLCSLPPPWLLVWGALAVVFGFSSELEVVGRLDEVDFGTLDLGAFWRFAPAMCLPVAALARFAA